MNTDELIEVAEFFYHEIVKKKININQYKSDTAQDHKPH